MSRAMLERYSHIRMAAKREAVKSLALPRAINSVSNGKEVPKERRKSRLSVGAKTAASV